MKLYRISCILLFVLCLSVQAVGKSIENEEENTNEIHEITHGRESTAEPEVESVSTELSTDPSAEAETIQLKERVEHGITDEPTTRQPEQCNADPYCEYRILYQVVDKNVHARCYF